MNSRGTAGRRWGGNCVTTIFMHEIFKVKKIFNLKNYSQWIPTGSCWLIIFIFMDSKSAKQKSVRWVQTTCVGSRSCPSPFITWQKVVCLFVYFEGPALPSHKKPSSNCSTRGADHLQPPKTMPFFERWTKILSDTVKHERSWWTSPSNILGNHHSPIPSQGFTVEDEDI